MIGTRAPGGALRRGRDVECQIGIDHGALRFRPLIRAGWGREGVVYGPFHRESGLVFAVSVTNGHNTSQATATPERFLKRVARWAVGPNADPPFLRGLEWLRSPRKRGTLRRLRWWAAIRPAAYRGPDLNENLALGWFARAVPGDHDWSGCYFMMHAAEGENGELWVRTGKRYLPAITGIRNIRIVYLIALRARGAVYYAAALAGAPGLGAFPRLRPLAVDPWDETPRLYAGLYQSVLGQIGWRVDTLTHGLRIERLPDFAGRFGRAHVGASFAGEGTLGADWTVARGGVTLTARGAVPAPGEAEGLAVTDPGAPSGLIHALVDCGSGEGAGGLVWRWCGPEAFCILRFSAEGCVLSVVQEGLETVVARDAAVLGARRTHSLQIRDADGEVGCSLDGRCLFRGQTVSVPSGEGTGVGAWVTCAQTVIRDLEAHPDQIGMPSHFDFAAPWGRLGTDLLVADDFGGKAGPLAGHAPARGKGRWDRSVGRGAFDLTGTGAVKVRGSPASPHPNRSFYTLPWPSGGFADLEVRITPPGTRRGQGHRGRAGLVLWQDRRNYLSVTTWLDDIYEGASISVFPKRHGFEELYDAVWTNVGQKVTWGRTFRLRCSCDGNNFLILVDDEPVMERALADLYPEDPPLAIRRVGLAANWEWGCDTGSTFTGFLARA